MPLRKLVYMLVLLSPAKTLDFSSPITTRAYSTPRLLEESLCLVEVLRGKTVADLAALMHISDDIAALNVDRFAEFSEEHTPTTARQALFAFRGDVYRGLDVTRFSARDLTEAQKTVRILSGLYGLLRPLDLVQPYRLEMGTKLLTERGKDLYAWWGTLITDLLRSDLDESPGSPVVINLASNEYCAAVDVERLGTRVVSPRFEDRDANGRARIVSFYAKRARGLMAAWLVKNRVRTSERLREFAEEGYGFDEARSTAEIPVFVR